MSSKVTFQVPSITCNHCVDKIEKFVGEIEGVSLIDVSIEEKSVSVEFDAPATENAIKEALLDAGQEVY
ncbi:copper-binding metallochaperone CopP [Helicobacter cetorum]|uniref:COP-associated protein n=1 Tax=Helicobacter cetorum (strain ATCC BAA-540 / CCUG 52418 / MIT 99-5656) TaxID=1163745 RepID=I0ETK5_HELCM|nr:copper-binding metallochaperone CopP [Helicobacter cetorum]AFI06274.1 COP-associated protein [Helicobacter cetorum MIT 99-5656]